MKQITLNSKLNGALVLHLISYNCNVIWLLKCLLKSSNLILGSDVVKLLKSKYYTFQDKLLPLPEEDIKLRQAIIKFNHKRKQVIEYNQYLEDLIRKELREDIEPDYIECDNHIELRFGI